MRWAVASAVALLVCAARADIGAPINTGAFKYQMQVTFSGYTGATSLSNFPALVVLNTGISGFNYSQFKTGGVDLRFADADGFEIAYEKDTWNTAGSSYIWVRMPRLSSSSDHVHAYWGNPSATLPAYATNGTTWSSYVGVWHLREAAAVDSSALRNHGTTGGTVSTATGLVGTAQSFFGAPTYPNQGWIGISAVADDVAAGSTFSISGFILTTFGGEATSGSTPFSIRTSTLANILWNRIGGTSVSNVPPGKAAIFAGSSLAISTGESVTNGQWRHIAYVRNGTTGTYYIDGLSRGVHTVSQTYAVNDLWHLARGVRSGASWSGYFIGKMDEMRVTTVARSGDWIAAENATARNNAGFTTYAAVEITPTTASAFFGW